VPLRAKSKFWRDEAGAITVDWLALTLAIAAMVVAFIAYFTPLLQAAAAGIFL
jgi:Flp pilus assembly protein TadG